MATARRRRALQGIRPQQERQGAAEYAEEPDNAPLDGPEVTPSRRSRHRIQARTQQARGRRMSWQARYRRSRRIALCQGPRPDTVEGHAKRGCDHQQVAAPRARRSRAKSREQRDGHAARWQSQPPPSWRASVSRRCSMAADQHGQQWKRRQRQRATGGRRIDQGRVEQDRKQARKTAAPSQRSAPAQAALGQRARCRQANGNSSRLPIPNRKRAERDGVGAAHNEPRHADRQPAERTAMQSRQLRQ